MRGIFVHVLPWLIVLAIGWMAGDRYGAPGWMRGVAETGFSTIETTTGGALGGVIDRVKDVIPLGDDDAADENADGANDDTNDDADDANDSADDDAAADSVADASPSEPVSGGLSANQDLRINAAGLQIIKDSEGLRLEPYSAGGHSYIGYGHQIQADESYTTISEAEAEALLRADLDFFENGVREALTRPANENQFSAMVSLAYNKGLYGFKDTNVLKRFNAGDISGAADDFRNHTGRDAPVPHLVERRERERLLFLK